MNLWREIKFWLCIHQERIRNFRASSAPCKVFSICLMHPRRNHTLSQHLFLLASNDWSLPTSVIGWWSLLPLNALPLQSQLEASFLDTSPSTWPGRPTNFTSRAFHAVVILPLHFRYMLHVFHSGVVEYIICRSLELPYKERNLVWECWRLLMVLVRTPLQFNDGTSAFVFQKEICHSRAFFVTPNSEAGAIESVCCHVPISLQGLFSYQDRNPFAMPYFLPQCKRDGKRLKKLRNQWSYLRRCWWEWTNLIKL